MKCIVRYSLLGIILFLFTGCPPKSAKLQKSITPPDKTLFETGSSYLQRSQYLKARLAFNTLISTYPDSDMTAEAYLGMGDSYYEEAGIDNLLQAEEQYKNFIIFYPTHPKAADAQMKIVSLNMKMLNTPDRDRQYTYKAEREALRFLEQFPDSDFIPIVKRYLVEIQEVLAKGDLGIALFYADNKDNYAAAISRYREIYDKYKGYSAMDDVLFKLADSLQKTNNPDEAAIYYGKITSEYPFSKRYEEATNRMLALGKPLPNVNTQLAELNKSRLKPGEGFSPLKPVADLVTALGLKGAPDRYKVAKKSIEAEKAKTAEARTSDKSEEGATGDDILIEKTLRQDPSGKVDDTTVSGGDSNTSQPKKVIKNGDKKKEPVKLRKRNLKKPS